VFVQAAGMVWRYRVTREFLSSFDTPLYFEPIQSAFAVRDSGENMFTHVVRGGTKPYKFALSSEKSGMAIDENTGVLTVDWKEAATVYAKENLQLDLAKEELTRQPHRRSSRSSRPSHLDADAFLTELKLSVRRPRNSALTYPARTKDTFRFPLSASIAVVDKNGQTALLKYVLAIEIANGVVTDAVAKFNEKVEKAEKALKKEQAEQEEKRKKAMETQAKEREKAALARKANSSVRRLKKQRQPPASRPGWTRSKSVSEKSKKRWAQSWKRSKKSRTVIRPVPRKKKTERTPHPSAGAFYGASRLSRNCPQAASIS